MIALQAQATPVLNPANGHLYDAISVPEGITWDDAKVVAEAMGGHLATINTVAENEFIYLNLPQAVNNAYWLGAYQPGEDANPDVDPAAGWVWVTGEPFDYSMWATFGGPSNEPNDWPGHGYQEDALHYWGGTGAWNDVIRGILLWGFVVEFDDADGDGILDSDDACPNSDLSGTIVIGGCNTGVTNVLLAGGCSMADEITHCAESASNHGGFVSCVTQLANTWKAQGLITGAQKGAITKCAAQSSVGK